MNLKDKQSRKDWCDCIDASSDSDIVELFVRIVMAHQELPERNARQTIYKNNTGFSATDAKFFHEVLDIADRYRNRDMYLAPKIELCRRKIKKYWRQFEVV